MEEKIVNEIGSIIVSKGPGSFSALRVGMSFAKGLSESLDIPLVGISTLEVEAARYFDTVQAPLCPLLEVGRNRIAWSLYQHKPNGWSLSIPEQITGLDGIVNSVPNQTIFCGEGAWDKRIELTELAPKTIQIRAQPPPTRLLGTLSRLGLMVLSAGQEDDRKTIVPNYLRSPSITMPSRKGQTEKLGQTNKETGR